MSLFHVTKIQRLRYITRIINEITVYIKRLARKDFWKESFLRFVRFLSGFFTLWLCLCDTINYQISSSLMLRVSLLCRQNVILFIIMLQSLIRKNCSTHTKQADLITCISREQDFFIHSIPLSHIVNKLVLIICLDVSATCMTVNLILEYFSSPICNI